MALFYEAKSDKERLVYPSRGTSNHVHFDRILNSLGGFAPISPIIFEDTPIALPSRLSFFANQSYEINLKVGIEHGTPQVSHSGSFKFIDLATGDVIADFPVATYETDRYDVVKNLEFENGVTFVFTPTKDTDVALIQTDVVIIEPLPLDQNRDFTINARLLLNAEIKVSQVIVSAAASGPTVADLGDLADVSTMNPEVGQSLVWDGNEFSPASILLDVDTTENGDSSDLLIDRTDPARPILSTKGIPSGTFSEHLLGQLFYSSHNTPSAGLLYMGETYNWSENPKLKSLFDENNHEFITDNTDGTFTVAQHADFLRAGADSIGVHVDDTTAVNGLTGSVARTANNHQSTSVNNGGGQSVRFNNSTRDVVFTGDDETAPDHRNAFFGIYGDLAMAVIDTDAINVDLTTPPEIGEALIWNGTSWTAQPVADDLSANVEALESAITLIPRTFDVFQATVGDTTTVFDWNTTSNLHINASAFYISDDPNVATPLTEITVSEGTSKDFYLVGILINNNNNASAGVHFTLTNNDGTLSVTYIEQRFVNNAPDYETVTYNQLTSFNNTVGLLNQTMIDYVYSTQPNQTVDFNELKTKLDSVPSTPTKTVINGITIREHADGYVEMWGRDTGATSTGADRIIPLPVTMENDMYDAMCVVINATADRQASISSQTTTELRLNPNATASDINWSVRGYKA